jgi:hypothetical protein
LLIGFLLSLMRSAAVTLNDTGDHPAPTAISVAALRTLRLSTAFSFLRAPPDRWEAHRKHHSFDTGETRSAARARSMTSQVKIVLPAALAIETHWMKQRARRPRSQKIPGISGRSVEPARFD